MKKNLKNRIVVDPEVLVGKPVIKGTRIPNLPHKGIVLMRLEDESAKNKLHIISKILDQYKNELPNNFIVVTEEKIRVRHFR